ncbi:PhaM family polyhydroxyalkanoate granule multifunctional regulatory protein, partial [Massilia phosphatilytica]
MTDTLDFVKNLWGSMQIPGTGLPGMPGMATPPMSTDDLDKRIADLEAVESWPNLDLTMLRGTIQALDV